MVSQINEKIIQENTSHTENYRISTSHVYDKKEEIQNKVKDSKEQKKSFDAKFENQSKYVKEQQLKTKN